MVGSLLVVLFRELAFGAAPIVPPSMNFALVRVCLLSSFPRATLSIQRTMRLTTGRASQWMWATDGSHHAKLGAESIQTSETSFGILIPLVAKK